MLLPEDNVSGSISELTDSGVTENYILHLQTLLLNFLHLHKRTYLATFFFSFFDIF